jgi:MYXO-CTERM domain-containing protein
MALPEDEPGEDPFEPSAACQRGIAAGELQGRGCGCTTQGAGGAGWLAWGLVVLGAVRARRRASRPSRSGAGQCSKPRSPTVASRSGLSHVRRSVSLRGRRSSTDKA